MDGPLFSICLGWLMSFGLLFGTHTTSKCDQLIWAPNIEPSLKVYFRNQFLQVFTTFGCNYLFQFRAMTMEHQIPSQTKFKFGPSSKTILAPRTWSQTRTGGPRKTTWVLKWAMMIRTFPSGQIQPRDTLSGWTQLAKVTGTFANPQFWRTGAITIMATITISFPFTFETHLRDVLLILIIKLLVISAK